MRNLQAEADEFCSLNYPEYTTIVKDPLGDKYKIEVLAWPGCCATGISRDDAARNLTNAKREWVLNRLRYGKEAIPLPHDYSQQRVAFMGGLRSSVQQALQGAIDNDVRLIKSNADSTILEVVAEIVATVRREKQQLTRRQKRVAANA